MTLPIPTTPRPRWRTIWLTGHVVVIVLLLLLHPFVIWSSSLDRGTTTGGGGSILQMSTTRSRIPSITVAAAAAFVTHNHPRRRPGLSQVSSSFSSYSNHHHKRLPSLVPTRRVVSSIRSPLRMVMGDETIHHHNNDTRPAFPTTTTTTESSFSLDNDQNNNDDKDSSNPKSMVISLPPSAIWTADQCRTIDALVEQRAKARWHGRYQEADALKHQVQQQVVQVLQTTNGQQQQQDMLLLGLPKKDNMSSSSWQIAIQDEPRRLGGGSTWELQWHVPTNSSRILLENQKSVLQLAHACLGMAVSLANTQNRRPDSSSTLAQHQEQQEQQQEYLVTRAKTQLEHWWWVHQRIIHQNWHRSNMTTTPNRNSNTTNNTPIDTTSANASTCWSDWIAVETQLQGRKACDAAFWFAMARVTDRRLFHLLVAVTVKELQRIGPRPSCRSKDLQAMFHRLAAAGVRSWEDEPNSWMKTPSASEHSYDPNLNEEDNTGPLSWSSLEQTQQRVLREKLSTSRVEDLLNLHSDASLLLLWKFSTRQRKQQAFLKQAAHHWETQQQSKISERDKNENLDSNITICNGIVETETHDLQYDPDDTASSGWEASSSLSSSSSCYDWSAMFQDSTRPLVVDVGCGMGVSLLGLATLSSSNTMNRTTSTDNHHPSSTLPFLDSQQQLSNCNFLGVDLSALAIGYATGIATRWNLTDRLQFVVDDATHLLTALATSYPGPVTCVLIQFPTPYSQIVVPKKTTTTSDSETNYTATRDQGGHGTSNENEETTQSSLQPNGSVVSSGNSQLPPSPTQGFMVTEELLQQAGQLLCRNGANGGHVLLQSNCEDVALFMRDLSYRTGWFSMVPQPSNHYSNNHRDSNDNATTTTTILTQRSQSWRAMGGEWAVGPEWWSEPILPRQGQTETEVACRLNKTPVHRCLLQTKPQS